MLAQPYVVEIEGKKFCLGHGDGLGKGDFGYKLLNWGFKNRFLQWMFSGIHPRWAFWMAHKWSRHNRLAHEDNPWQWRGEDERIVKFANEFQKEHGGSVDYFIFGHFHYRTQMELREGGQMYLLGEWVNGSDYLMFDGQELHSLNME
jgi:UDP-2,3-diacylglucosamine hydrolase